MEIKDGVLIINGRTVGKVSDVEIDSITNTVNSINKSINAWKDSIYSKTASFEEGLFAYMCNDFENLRDYKLSDGIVYYKGKRVGRYLFTEEDMRKIWDIARNYSQEDKLETFITAISKINKAPTKVWLEMEEVLIPKHPEVGLGIIPDHEEDLRIKTELRIKVDENNYVKVLRYE